MMARTTKSGADRKSDDDEEKGGPRSAEGDALLDEPLKPWELRPGIRFQVVPESLEVDHPVKGEIIQNGRDRGGHDDLV
jgi:hypothetical protein